MTAVSVGAQRPSVNPRSRPRRSKREQAPADTWMAQVQFVRRKRSTGFSARVVHKLGQLSFVWYQSRPLPDQQQAHLLAQVALEALRVGKPVPVTVWWTYHVTERRVAAGKSVWVGVVRKWLGAASYVWREIAPCDSKAEALRIARHTVAAGQALEGYPLRKAREVKP